MTGVETGDAIISLGSETTRQATEKVGPWQLEFSPWLRGLVGELGFGPREGAAMMASDRRGVAAPRGPDGPSR
jgi:hypothetical protein